MYNDIGLTLTNTVHIYTSYYFVASASSVPRMVLPSTINYGSNVDENGFCIILQHVYVYVYVYVYVLACV